MPYKRVMKKCNTDIHEPNEEKNSNREYFQMGRSKLTKNDNYYESRGLDVPLAAW